MEFDKYKCLKLLKERKSLKKEGKLLRDSDKAKNNELISYLILLEDQIFWKSGKEYIQILESFCSNKTNLADFFRKFWRLRDSNLSSARMWKEKLEEEAFVVFTQSNKIDIQLNPKSCGFTKIISYLHSLVDACDSDVTLEMNLKQPELLWYGISEEYCLTTIKKYCKNF